MRVDYFQTELKNKNIDLAVFFSLDEKPNINVIYYSGYSGIGLLVIPKEKPAFLVVPEMEYEKAKKTKNKVFKAEKKKRLLETVCRLVSKLNIKKIGIEEDACSVYLYKKLKKAIKARYVDISKICSWQRSVKYDEEISKIKNACRVTDRTYKKICENFNFKTEREVKDFILTEFKKNNCEPAYPPIVGSEKNSSQPHYNGEKKIKKGFLLLDFGAKYKGYCSDMTRMIYVGSPNKKELEDYNLVLNTVLGCESALYKKKRFSDIYSLSLKILDKKAKYFTHGLGHGLGLEIHESPSLTKDDKSKIREDVVFTIEPGIYFLNKYGIRIEDTILMKKNEFEILTRSRKDLVVIKKDC
jgi:Xaa-Pro aminopeptidase